MYPAMHRGRICTSHETLNKNDPPVGVLVSVVRKEQHRRRPLRLEEGVAGRGREGRAHPGGVEADPVLGQARPQGSHEVGATEGGVSVGEEVAVGPGG